MNKKKGLLIGCCALAAVLVIVLVCVFSCGCSHTYEEKASSDYLKSEATCESAAVYYKSCSKCGEKSEETFTSGDALGHEYGEWTSNGDGTHSKTCTKDAIHKVTESCTGGTATCTEKAVCEVCNEKYGEALDHAYGEWVSNGDGTHTKTCTNDASHAVTELCSGGTATCSEKATCEACGGKHGELLEHTYSEEWSFNGAYHWHDATCGCDVQGDKAAHEMAADGMCEYCGAAVTAIDGNLAATNEADLTKNVETYSLNGLNGIFYYWNQPLSHTAEKIEISYDILSSSVPAVADPTGSHAGFSFNRTIFHPNYSYLNGTYVFYTNGGSSMAAGDYAADATILLNDGSVTLAQMFSVGSVKLEIHPTEGKIWFYRKEVGETEWTNVQYGEYWSCPYDFYFAIQFLYNVEMEISDFRITETVATEGESETTDLTANGTFVTYNDTYAAYIKTDYSYTLTAGNNSFYYDAKLSGEVADKILIDFDVDSSTVESGYGFAFSSEVGTGDAASVTSSALADGKVRLELDLKAGTVAIYRKAAGESGYTLAETLNVTFAEDGFYFEIRFTGEGTLKISNLSVYGVGTADAE